MIRELYLCSCGVEGVIVDDFEGAISIALYSYGQGGNKLSLWNKLRWCYNIVMTGQTWSDQIIMDPETAMLLAESISRRARSAYPSEGEEGHYH